MSTKSVVHCDFCDKAKGETNHWYQICVENEVFECSHWDSNEPGKDACGEECVHTALSRYLSTGKL